MPVPVLYEVFHQYNTSIQILETMFQHECKDSDLIMQSKVWIPISEVHNQNKNSYSKNPTGQKITGVFFPEYMEKKVDFGIRVR